MTKISTTSELNELVKSKFLKINSNIKCLKEVLDLITNF